MAEVEKSLNLAVIGHFAGYSRKKFGGHEMYLKPLMSKISLPLSEWLDEFARAVNAKKEEVEVFYSKASEIFRRQEIPYDVVCFWDDKYPRLLRSTEDAPIALFYQGDLSLLLRPAIAIVGTRKPSEKGRLRARKLAMMISRYGFVISSGLAEGIDTEAHSGALECGGKTVSVIGTPINTVYPKPNRDLQDRISQQGLVISQFPFTVPVLPANFPIRNYTMSGISAATIVVEAGETSGALIQARQCLEQNRGRRLFILKNVLDSGLKWPKKFCDLGAHVIDDENLEEVIEPLHELRNFEPTTTRPALKIAAVKVA